MVNEMGEEAGGTYGWVRSIAVEEEVADGTFCPGAVGGWRVFLVLILYRQPHYNMQDIASDRMVENENLTWQRE
jgi:hypothetical protein